MSNRHLARAIAMQALYQWDFREKPGSQIKEIIDYNKKEFAPDFDDGGFTEELVRGIIENLPQIDAFIVKYAPEWPLQQITVIDRNVLRLGTYELKFSQNIPSRVAINEAIELAKTFGGESSGRFVNGVLGAIYKDMLARGEEKEADKEIPAEQKEQDESGAVEPVNPTAPGESGEPT